MYEKLLVGADPELFAFDVTMDAYKSVHNLLKGTKQKPFGVKRGAVQVDGTAAEFNIDPAATKEEFLRNLNTVQHQMQQMLPNHLQLRATPVVVYPADYWGNLPEEVQEIGCDPDFNAYAMGAEIEHERPQPGFCAGGGHVHLGWGQNLDKDPQHMFNCAQVVTQLDFALGLASFKWDDDNERRQLYGQAGAYRPKPYGVEYRTLSNAWVKDEVTSGYVYDLTRAAMNAMDDGCILAERFEPDLAQRMIDNNMRNSAIKLHAEVEQELKKYGTI